MVEARPQRAPRMGALSDADLVARAQAGDREAFDPLYRRYASQIARFAAGRAVRWGRGPDFAEDVAASTWETALSKIDQYQGLAGRAEPGYEDCSPFRAWLYGVAKHQLFHTAQAAGFEVATAAEDLAWLGERAASVPAEYGEDDQ